MKNIISQIRISVLTSYLFAIQTCSVYAQITTLSEEVSNAEVQAQILHSNAEAKAKADAEYLRLHPAEATNALNEHQLWLLDIAGGRIHPQHLSPEEVKEMKNLNALFLTNAAAQSSYFFHLRGGMTESQYASNVLNAMRHAPPPKPWPEPSKKQEIFEHCAALLHSAIDTNQIEIACKKLTNQPAAALVLKSVANEAATDLHLFASLLFSPDLKSYFGYPAKLATPTNIFYFNFWWSNYTNTDTPVRDLEERTPDAKYVLINARFDENCKLTSLIVNSFDKEGVFGTEKQLVFNDDGTLRSFWQRPVEPKP